MQKCKDKERITFEKLINIDFYEVLDGKFE